ncbi:hypothetical protein WKH57_01440 [Niallia taxi]|uniref:hypothetical protein n=1 Tax=Niallia taxi TaxID=2499688 RepID=UPI0031803661
MYVSWDEAKKAVEKGRKVNFYYRGKQIVLDKSSNMKDLYREFGYIDVTVYSVINGKYIII